MQIARDHAPVGRFDLDAYPTLQRLAKDPAKLLREFAALAEGDAAGQIRNVVYNDAREIVSRAVDAVWSAIRAPHAHGRWDQLPRDVQELDMKIHVYGIHNVPAAYKRLLGSKLTHPMVEDMRALAIELAPLASALTDLKAKIVKGRALSTGPSKPVNPNKVVKTCPCCFRKIAVIGGTMAHHGYQRPGHGWQTASCPGIRFKPLEVSDEGLVWLIDSYREQLASCQAALARASKSELDTILVRRRKSWVNITPDMPEWDKELRIWVAMTESEIRNVTGSLTYCEKVLADWKPEEPTQ